MSKEQDMNIRELAERAIDDAITRGVYSGLPVTLGRSKALHDHRESRAALLAAIDRLELKAATAKAECEAWREQEAAHADLITTDPQKQDAAHERINAADRAIDAARAATDAAWREPAPENKEAKQ